MKNTSSPVSLIVALLATFSMSAVAGDADAGKKKSTACAGCHGQAGISPNREWPNLASQKDKYIISQLKAFKSGDRKSPLMEGQAAGLSDEDIANLAAYYSSL